MFGRKIKDFDLIIFDRYAQQSILPYIYLENIAKYVREGGGAADGGGAGILELPMAFTILRSAAFQPAEPGDDVEAPYRARVSDEGSRHPVTRGLTVSTETTVTELGLDGFDFVGRSRRTA